MSANLIPKPYMKKLLKIIGVIFSVVILLLTGTGLWLTSAANRNRILQYAVSQLADKLQTTVSIDSVDVRIFRGTLDVFNLRVDDRQQRKMLCVDTVSVALDVMALLSRDVSISHAAMCGVDFVACTDTDGVANYQFVIDTFSSPAKHKKTKTALSFDLKKAELTRVHVSYDEREFTLGALSVEGSRNATINIADVRYGWKKMRPRGMMASECHLSHALITATIDADTTGTARVVVDSIFFNTCIDAPHKRTGKPMRGYFDDGHMRTATYVELEVPFWSKDSASVCVRRLAAYDHASGLGLDSVRLTAGINRRRIDVSDISITMTKSHFDIPDAVIELPDSTRPLTFRTGMIDGTVVLTDISRPFAPVALRQFRMPLRVNAVMEGDTSVIRFRRAHVFTTDNRFSVHADGYLTGMKKKKDLNVHFDVRDMRITNAKVFEIIYQFPIKKFMMTQLKQLGTIGFNGNLNVHYKRELIDGMLTTAAGPIAVALDIDDLNKYLHGKVTTKTFDLGKAVEMPALGQIDCTASFDFDISKPRTALIHRRNKGKLPVGSVKAKVNLAHYKKLKFTNIDATINSDGALAQGQIFTAHRSVDLMCDFSFTSTDSVSKMKIKPHVDIHIIDGIKQKHAARKEKRIERRKEKEERNAIRKQEKAERKAERRRAKEEKKKNKVQKQESAAVETE